MIAERQVYMWNRWQDPSLGRFISEDPVRDGSNWYAYAGGNPINNVDPMGLAPQNLNLAQQFLYRLAVKAIGDSVFNDAKSIPAKHCSGTASYIAQKAYQFATGNMLTFSIKGQEITPAAAADFMKIKADSFSGFKSLSVDKSNSGFNYSTGKQLNVQFYKNDGSLTYDSSAKDLASVPNSKFLDIGSVIVMVPVPAKGDSYGVNAWAGRTPEQMAQEFDANKDGSFL